MMKRPMPDAASIPKNTGVPTLRRLMEAAPDAVTSGIGQLVDADMNAESTRLSALQVQQQLSQQSLSMANSMPNVLLSLFK